MLRLARSFAAASKGLARVAAGQPNFRFHLGAAVGVAALALWLGVEPLPGAVLALTVGAVLAAEAANTALEELADALHPEDHPGVGRAKDAAAAAVLLLAVTAVVVGVLVLGPALWERLV